jgi:TRAP-type uncharacterized transport system substrate-binding protein
MQAFLKKLVNGWRGTAFYQALDRNLSLRISTYVLVMVVVLLCAWGFFYSAPPNTITLTSGPPDSQFQRTAEKYSQILARNGVKLKILPSQGSQENIQRLDDPHQHVDVGFVQSGVADPEQADKLVSLGSVFYEPLMIFYRSKTPMTLLSEFKGKRLNIGPAGSGAHQLGLELLKQNGIEPGGSTALLEGSSDEASQALLSGKMDAVFLMGDSAKSDVIRTLLRDENIRLLSFPQADAYTRREVFLNKLQLPKGAIDFGQNIPAEDVTLIGPTVELVARKGLHPALSDLLLEAAQEVHGKPSLLQRRGEFPAPLEQGFKISDDASRYYKSGKTLLYRYMPYWVASLTDRLLVVVLPVIVLLIPGLRIIPAIYNWRIRSRILRCYGALLVLERDAAKDVSGEHRDELLKRLHAIEMAVHRLNIPVFFADQFYVLRGDIEFVRNKLASGSLIKKKSGA